MNKSIILGLNVLLGFSLIFFSSYRAVPHETTIKLSGIRNNKGKIMIQIFRDELAYEKEQPDKTLVFEKTGIQSGKMTIKISIAQAVYGLTVIDDENGNGKIDKNLIGIPKEGFGFSNFFMEKLKKPKFEAFRVDLNKLQQVEMRIKYM